MLGAEGEVRKGELALWHPGRWGHLLRRGLGRAGALPEHLPREQMHQCTGGCPRGRPPSKGMEETMGYSRVPAFESPFRPPAAGTGGHSRGCSAGTHTQEGMDTTRLGTGSQEEACLVRP